MNSVRMAHINTQKFLSSPAANNLQNVFSAQQEIIDDYTQVKTDPIKHPRGTLPCNHGLLSKLFFQPSTTSLELTQQFGV